MQDNGMDAHKMASLMELMKTMKLLQADSMHGEPKGMEVEVHAHKLDPQELEKMEEETHQDLDNDNEEGESPEHKAAVLGDEGSPDEESSESSNEEDSEMQMPDAFKKLLLEKLMGK